MTSYDKSIELKMQRLFATLSEKDRRRYAGIEAAELEHGGIDYGRSYSKWIPGLCGEAY